MARAFRKMISTRIEPTSHKEILDVTTMIYAGAKSFTERIRLVQLSEILA